MTTRKLKTRTCGWCNPTPALMLRPLAQQTLHNCPPGSRVKNSLDGRLGMIYSSPERARASLALVPVMVEGSTRRELWATHTTRLLPRTEQFVALGGTKSAPAGYPLTPLDG
jgi:hypothetical protein